MLQGGWQRGQMRRVWHVGHCSALRQIGGLLMPASKGEPAPSKPSIELGNSVGAINRVQERVRKGVGLSEVLGPPGDSGEWVVLGERADRGADLPQFLLVRPNPEQTAVLLHHVDAAATIRRVDHDV